MLRKEVEAKTEEFEGEQKILRAEQNDYREQLESLLEHFNDKWLRLNYSRENWLQVCVQTFKPQINLK